ncbi:MAG: hypothetical protein ABIQ57_08925 [Candidatus Kapaibacterium sp.]
MKHPFRLYPQRHLQLICGESNPVGGGIAAGIGIMVGANGFHQLLDILPWNILGSLEHQMFKEMREPRPVLPLIAGTDVIFHYRGNHRRVPINREHHAQTIGKRKSLHLYGRC